MDELWIVVQQQQAAMQEQRDEISYLKTQLEQQRLDKLALSGRMRAMEESGGDERPRVSRAGLLEAAAVSVAGFGDPNGGEDIFENECGTSDPGVLGVVAIVLRLYERGPLASGTSRATMLSTSQSL